jgi:LPXTG-site transpeptidase (sortase) family protein
MWLWPAAFIVVGLLLGMATIVTVIHNRQTEPKPPLGSSLSGPAPSSVKPKPEAIASYSVPPADPKYLTIPAIRVTKARIVQLGLMKNNEIAVPDNIYDAGWYKGSVKPGQKGAMFIYGHVSNWTAHGMFYSLKKLEAGDKIIVTRGDNKTFIYQVNATRIYPYDKVDMSQVLAPTNADKPSLNLMTCTGQIIKGTSEFSERLVVFTSLVSS